MSFRSLRLMVRKPPTNAFSVRVRMPSHRLMENTLQCSGQVIQCRHHNLIQTTVDKNWWLDRVDKYFYTWLNLCPSLKPSYNFIGWTTGSEANQRYKSSSKTTLDIDAYVKNTHFQVLPWHQVSQAPFQFRIIVHHNSFREYFRQTFSTTL